MDDGTLESASAAWLESHGATSVDCHENYVYESVDDDDTPHVGHFSKLGGTWWCDTCNSPYCELA